MHVLILHNAKLAYVPVPYMVTPPIVDAALLSDVFSERL